MSITYTIWCDHDECQNWIYSDPTDRTQKDAEEFAKKRGWVRKKGGEHICPLHKDEGKKS